MGEYGMQAEVQIEQDADGLSLEVGTGGVVV
jgi:hypothetical protein